MNGNNQAGQDLCEKCPWFGWFGGKTGNHECPELIQLRNEINELRNQFKEYMENPMIPGKLVERAAQSFIDAAERYEKEFLEDMKAGKITFFRDTSELSDSQP